MASGLTLESYLKNNSSVKAARKKLEAAGKKLETAKKAQAGSRNASANVIADIESAIKTARSAYQSAKSETDAIEAKASAYFEKKYSTITTKKAQSSLAELEAQLPKAKSQQEYQAIQQAITEAKSTIANPPTYVAPTFKPIPKANGTISTQPGTAMQVEDFADTLKNARKELKSYTPQQLIDLGKQLNAAGIASPEVGTYTDALLLSYNSAIASAQGAYTANKEFGTLSSYLADQQAQRKAMGLSGGGAGGPVSTTDIYRQISSKTDAAATINQQFQALLGRDATSGELATLTKKLNSAEAKNAEITKSTKGATGSSSTNRTTMLNSSEFIAEQIKKMPEFSTKKAAKAELTTQSIANTIKANGLTISPEQVAAWTKEVENGGDIRNIENKIRALAATGLPDNVKKLIDGGINLEDIYSPYKKLMAGVLELDPNAIDFNDPALRSAIGANGEMPLYDFQRQLRQDSRWQYTNNAREEVSNSVMGVLKDFGFMG